jgi:glycosyltransferase involved in cell wall biosynthesis
MREASISVIIPTFDRPKLAERALESVRCQTRKAGEIIVVDDGSRRCYAETLGLHDPAIRVIRLGTNLGPAAARNAGLRVASGEIICFLDDDDEYHPQYLSVVNEALREAPADVGLCWTGVLVKWCESTRLQSRVRDYSPRIRDRKSLLQSFLSIGLGHGVAVRRSCFAEVGPFCEGLRLVEDTEWFLRFLARGYVPLAIPGVHVTVHCHEESRLTSAERDIARRRECEVVLIRMAAFLTGHPDLRDMLQSTVGLSGRT